MRPSRSLIASTWPPASQVHYHSPVGMRVCNLGLSEDNYLGKHLNLRGNTSIQKSTPLRHSLPKPRYWSPSYISQIPFLLDTFTPQLQTLHPSSRLPLFKMSHPPRHQIHQMGYPIFWSFQETKPLFLFRMTESIACLTNTHSPLLLVTNSTQFTLGN